jgi:DNA (cytosine-5)-methyltransferase 1
LFLNKIIYNEYIFNNIKNQDIDKLKNKVDEGIKNVYASGVKLLKQLFEFEKVFFDEKKINKNGYVDFVFNSIKKEYHFPVPELFKRYKNTIGDILSKPYPKGELQEVWNLPPSSMKIVKYIPEGGSWKNIPTKHLPERFMKIRSPRSIKTFIKIKYTVIRISI